jgi:predicted ATPase/DNA-binding winged helix-turn-helix (wHTH) protein
MPDESVRLVHASGECEIDLARRELRILGSAVPVGGRAFEIIELLARSAGELVAKDELLDRIWPGAIVGENTLHVHAGAIRKALGPYRSLLKTESGRGYRLLGDWTIPRQDAPRPPVGLRRMPVDGESSVTNFPAIVTHLIGRTAAVARLRDLISAYRAVTLTGPGGIGKTSLALKAAGGVVGEFADGGWLVELAPLSDPSLVPSAVAGAVRLKLSEGRISAEIVARTIGDRELLLVLDNCEHVIEAAAEMAELLVRLCPRVTIVATSREVLRIEGEHVYRVTPLDVPPVEAEKPDDILGRSAVELLVARSKELGSSFQLSAKELSSAAAICRHLDGIPLAIEFAAARVAMLGIHAVASGLTDRFALLTAGRRTALPRHQTLRAALDWSYDLLPETEQLLLRGLAIFPGGFTVDAAVAVMKDIIADPSAVTAGIANLVAKSLIAPRLEAASRWRMFETICAYALEKLAGRGEYPGAARRHAEYFRDLIAPVAESSTDLSSADDLARCDRELDNVRAALDWSFSPEGDATIGVTLTAAFAAVWTQIFSQAVSSPRSLLAMSLAGECRDRVDKMLAYKGTNLGLSTVLERRMFTAYAMALALTLAPAEKVRAAVTRAQRLVDEFEEVEWQLHLLWVQWWVEVASGNYRTSLTAARSMKAVSQLSIAGATRLIGDRYLGSSLLYAGRLHEARDLLQRVADNYVAPSDQRHARLFHYDQHLMARSKLAVALCLLGYLDRASEEACLSFASAEASEAGFTLCWVLHDGQCPIALETGDLAAAETAITAMGDRAARTNSALWETFTSAWRGKLLIERGVFAEGVALVRHAVDVRERTGWQLCHAQFLGYLAKGLAGLGRLDEACDTIKRAIARAEQSGEGLYHAELIRLMGELLLRRSAEPNAAEGEDCFRRANELAREQGALLWQLRIALSFARLRVAQERHGEARQILTPVYDRFTEGFGTTDLRAAKALLDELPA